VEISSQQLVNPPSQIDVFQDADVTVRKTLHNNGPFGPVDVSISASLSPPAGCTATPSPTNPSSASLPVSTNVLVDEVWTINCTQEGLKSFVFSNLIDVTTAYVTDPDPTNNFSTFPWSVTVNV
jgi:hypothetical protein